MRPAAAPRRTTGAPRSAPWPWAVAGVVLGIVACLVLWAPAVWVANALVWGGAPVRLYNAEGTVWNGRAQVLLQRDAAEPTALPGTLQWQLRPLWQDGLPGLRVRWQADCCLSAPWQWQLTTDTHQLYLQAQDLTDTAALRLPAAWLTGLGTPWNTLQPQGRLQLHTRGLALQVSASGVQMQGLVQLDVQDLSTSLSTLRPVGSYRLALVGANPAGLELSTLEGALQLQGKGRVGPRGVVFDGEARAAEGLEDALSNLLNIIGQRQGARSLIHLG